MDNHFVVCSCSSSEHTIRFIHDAENNELYTEVQLKQHRSFFKRIFVAFQYLIGYTSKYGHWDCTLVSKEEARKLTTFLRTYTNE